MKPERRGSWYLLTGAVIGVILGLVYSWEISPVKYVDAPPSALRADYKDDYRLLVSLAFMYNHDLLRAEGRLAQLKDDQIAQSIRLQVQRAQANGSSSQEVRALTELLDALGDGGIPGTLGPVSATLTAPTPQVAGPTLASPPPSPDAASGTSLPAIPGTQQPAGMPAPLGSQVTP